MMLFLLWVMGIFFSAVVFIVVLSVVTVTAGFEAVVVVVVVVIIVVVVVLAKLQVSLLSFVVARKPLNISCSSPFNFLVFCPRQLWVVLIHPIGLYNPGNFP